MRKELLVNEEYYHIYNRGVDKRQVFLNFHDYERFLLGMKEFNREEAIGSLYEKYLREKRVGEATSDVHYGRRMSKVGCEKKELKTNLRKDAQWNEK